VAEARKKDPERGHIEQPVERRPAHRAHQQAAIGTQLAEPCSERMDHALDGGGLDQWQLPEDGSESVGHGVLTLGRRCAAPGAGSRPACAPPLIVPARSAKLVISSQNGGGSSVDRSSGS
jgi:hypothetical protein